MSFGADRRAGTAAVQRLRPDHPAERGPGHARWPSRVTTGGGAGGVAPVGVREFEGV